MLDLARDVCAPKDRGYFMVPQKLTFEESRHICKKLTGAPISYTDKAEFEASAVKRSIGFKIGFHNHGEGPYQ